VQEAAPETANVPPMASRFRTLLAALVAAGTFTVAAASPASADGPGTTVIVWAASCPGPDLGNPLAYTPTPMEVSLTRNGNGTYRLGTSQNARCSFVYERGTSTVPTGASLGWWSTLSGDEVSNVCAGKSVRDNRSGRLALDPNAGSTPETPTWLGVEIDGTGSEIVVHLQRHTSTMVVHGYGVFTITGSNNCRDVLDGDPVALRGAMEIYDPTFEGEDGPPPVPEPPAAPELDLSTVAELRSKVR